MLGILVKVVIDYQKSRSKIDALEKAVDKFEGKFHDLFENKDKTNETLIELSTTLKMLVQNIDNRFVVMEKQLEKFDKKIDELKDDVKKVSV